MLTECNKTQEDKAFYEDSNLFTPVEDRGMSENEEETDAGGVQNCVHRTSATLDNDLEMLFASVNSLSEMTTEKEKGPTRLPGFLFPDGHDKIVTKDSLQDASSVTVDSFNAPLPLNHSFSFFSSASEECERLTKNVYSSSYQVLRLPPNASEETIKQSFRKLSLLIHPDKCHHPAAQDAFLVVNQAYEDLQRPEKKEKFRLVYSEAEKRVMKNIAKENKRRQKQNLPPLGMDGAKLQETITEMCNKLLEEYTENQEYAEKCRKANEALEKQAEETLLREEKEEAERKKKWESTMETRVEGWRDFKEGVRTKRLKVAAFVPVTHQREQRKPGDKSVPSKPKGIDETYKQNWR